MNINSKFKTGIKWTLLAQLFMFIFEFVFGIILSRLLSPSDFGTLATISVLILFSQIITNSGFSQSIIRQQNISNLDLSSIFYFNLIASLLLYCILYLYTPVISSFLNIDSLNGEIKVIGLSIIFHSLTIVYRSIFVKNLKFKELNIIISLSSFTAGVIAIIYAYLGYGIWSLIYRVLTNNIITIILMFLYLKWIPSKNLSFTPIKKHWNFSKMLLLSGLLAWFYKDFLAILLGRLFSIEKLGFYNRAEMLRNLVTTNIEGTITSVSYPILSTLQDDKSSFLKLVFKIQRNTFLIVGILLVFLATTAEPLVKLLLGYKWIYTAKILFYLSLSGIFIPLISILLNSISVYGRSDLYLKTQIFLMFYAFLALIWGYYYGFEYFLLGLVFSSILGYIHVCLVFNKLFSFSLLKQFKFIQSKLYLFLICVLFTRLISGFVIFENNLLIISFNAFILLLIILFYYKKFNDEEMNYLVSYPIAQIKKISKFF